MKIRATLQVFGSVQGVGFRYSAEEIARKLHVVGYAQNKPDGTVFIDVEGVPENVQDFIDWCHAGPSTARVTNVIVERRVDLKNYRSFGVL